MGSRYLYQIPSRIWLELVPQSGDTPLQDRPRPNPPPLWDQETAKMNEQTLVPFNIESKRIFKGELWNLCALPSDYETGDHDNGEVVVSPLFLLSVPDAP